jgi:hypothetical protein
VLDPRAGAAPGVDDAAVLAAAGAADEETDGDGPEQPANAQMNTQA